MKFISLFSMIFLVSCSNYGQLNYIVKLPKSIKENSGMTTIIDSTMWFVEDSGNDNILYKVNHKGQLLRELTIKNVANHDWEDLAKDDKQNVYIGDFGNNDNLRKNLSIYKIPNPETVSGNEITAEIISFYYPEQKDFPPKKDELFFDAESLFYFKDHLYIITKNRSHPFNGEAFLYRVPAKKGHYAAEYLDVFTAKAGKKKANITSADISPDGKTLVLLSNGFLWVFTDFKDDHFFEGRVKVIDLGIRTQLESVTFTDNHNLLLSDERSKKTGGNLYSFSLRQ